MPPHNSKFKASIDFVVICFTTGRQHEEERDHIKDYHGLAVKILTVVCINQDEIMEKLFRSVSRPDTGFLTSADEQRYQFKYCKWVAMLFQFVVKTDMFF